MTDRIAQLLWLGVVLALIAATDVSAASEKVFSIGYLELESDQRYKDKRIEARLQAQPWGRPFAGAEVALRDARFATAALGIRIELRRHTVADDAALTAALKTLRDEGVDLVLLDVPGAAVKALASATKGQDVLLFNLSAPDDELRQKSCQGNLLHVLPSHAMRMDALAQFLVSKKWRDVLVLQGPLEDDAALGRAFDRAAKRFGLKVAERKPFTLGRDPRQRNQNNIALLTSGARHDVVVVLDSDGEFAREVPYHTQLPRPVVGSAGLVADGWSWAWDRHGAPQLNGRFQKHAQRWMTQYDWAAWMATKAIAEALQRTESTEFGPLRDFILGEQIVLDGFKGYPLSFRGWNRQLRQPVFLTTTNWVIERAPIEGFLHDQNNLDTLGFDARETECGIAP
ncbi:MAG: ABC transporter substrate-binding protein [Thiotrichales bacterium]